MIEDPEAGSYFKTRVSEWSEWELKHDSLRTFNSADFADPQC